MSQEEDWSGHTQCHCPPRQAQESGVIHHWVGNTDRTEAVCSDLVRTGQDVNQAMWSPPPHLVSAPTGRRNNKLFSPFNEGKALIKRRNSPRNWEPGLKIGKKARAGGCGECIVLCHMAHAAFPGRKVGRHRVLPRALCPS